LPPALAGGKGMNIKLALAKKDVIWLKPFHTISNFIPPAKAGGNLILFLLCSEQKRTNETILEIPQKKS
jgi:hypothetical protein